MRRATLLCLLLAALILAAPIFSFADNGTYTYAGGVFTTGASVGQNIAVQNAAMSATGATLSFSCPITSYGAGTYAINWTCAGGTVTIATPDNSVVFQGTFVSGSMGFSGSGGGRGGHVTYYYSFFGMFSGTVTSGGVTEIANGSLSQYVKTTAQIGTGSAAVTAGSLGWNSAYSPLLVGDSANGRVVSVDGLSGANLASYGTPGTGTGHFGTIAGLAQDSLKQIYVADSASSRIVRIDKVPATSWMQVGSYGTGVHHFSSPQGVAIDAGGKIWVADTGNNRIVRMDDMSGTNWVSFGTLGSGANQFNGPSSIAFDGAGRIYVADTGNNRLVRFDDVVGTNWVALTEVFSGIYGYPFIAPKSVAVNAAGQIFVGLSGSYAYLIRVDDMTGLNPSLSQWSYGLTGISLDAAGTIYAIGGPNSGVAEVETPAGVGYFAGTLGGAVPQPTAVLAAPTTVPTPAAPAFTVPAPGTGLAFANQNVGSASGAQTAVLTNVGSGALTITSVVPGMDFLQANNCGTALAGGASCKVNVRFAPRLTGFRNEYLAVNSNGAHAKIKLPTVGTGTAPTATILPVSLGFDAQTVGTSSGSQIVTLSNNGTGLLTIKSIVAAGDFSQTNNCGTSVQPGDGCTIFVVFKPTVAGARTGTLTIADDLIAHGVTQVVALSGTGASGAAAFTLSPESVQFAVQGVQTTSLSQTITLTNHSGAAAALGAPVYPASGFVVTTTCGATLANNASCVFHAAFAPVVAGPVAGVITISITGQAALTVGLSGTGVGVGGGAVLMVNPASVLFGPISVGDNPSQVVTITTAYGLIQQTRILF